MRHREQHFSERIGWLRATVLGANDGIVSTASLIIGVAAATADRSSVLVAGVAGGASIDIVNRNAVTVLELTMSDCDTYRDRKGETTRYREILDLLTSNSKLDDEFHTRLLEIN